MRASEGRVFFWDRAEWTSWFLLSHPPSRVSLGSGVGRLFSAFSQVAGLHLFWRQQTCEPLLSCSTGLGPGSHHTSAPSPRSSLSPAPASGSAPQPWTQYTLPRASAQRETKRLPEFPWRYGQHLHTRAEPSESSLYSGVRLLPRAQLCFWE